MENIIDNEKVNRVAELIKESKYTVVLTGAGVSTGSGIADFRTPGKGLWEKVDPFKVTSITAFNEDPQRFYYFYRPRIEMLSRVSPNPAHKAIAQLEEMGYVKRLITQNIDNLHQRAGSKKVIEVHGTLREAICQRCRKMISSEILLKKIDESEEKVPYCECGGVLKPNVVLFGEMLPNLDEAVNQSMRADLMLTVGSSLQVSPVNILPQYCLDRGGKLIIVNFMSTHLDYLAEVVVKEDVCDFLPAVVEVLRRK
ncbi:MAG TPA: NAD-dependent protein deacylase [Candidatus Atribacteria bacterium]|mgnify:FL=1|nr:NAD-dependent protein deacylase [Candidatus Atribacteria bacterium]